MKSLYVKVAGVTFEGRQLVLADIKVGDFVQLRPEPENQYDENAIAVWVGRSGKPALQVGYVPREQAKICAPLMDGEAVVGKVFEMTGGFEKWDGSRASLGCVVRFELPDNTDI